MAGKSDYLENKILDHILGGGDYTRPSDVYIALFTSNPTDAGGGTEVSGGSYARAAVTNNSTNFPAASGGVKANGTDINFPTATALRGTVQSVGVFDDPTGGNLLFWAPLVAARTINNGDAFSFAVGQLQFTED